MSSEHHTMSNTERRAEARRERLRSLMDRLEAALAEPPRRDTEQWHAALGQIAAGLADDLQDHIEGTEGPQGLFDEVIERAPRLRNAVERLRADHPRIRQHIIEFTELVGAGSSASTEQVRELGSTLLIELIGHRQRGADLLYEAYWVDVAPSD